MPILLRPVQPRLLRSTTYSTVQVSEHNKHCCYILGLCPDSSLVDLQESARRHVAVCAVASQAGAPPPRAGKKKVKKMVDITGEVQKDLSNGMFQVKLENGVAVLAHLSGKIRQNRIKVVVGDKVTVELSPYDLTKGRITLRHKPGEATPPASS